jgi:hypothetical protein
MLPDNSACRNMKYTLFCFVNALCASTYAQAVELLSQDGFTITNEAAKIEMSEKHDTWRITITVTPPAKDSYFIPKKTEDLLSYVHPGRYVQIRIINHSGILTAGDKYITAEPARLITADNSKVYIVKAVSHQESYTVNIPKGELPKLSASFIATLTPFNDIPVIKATKAELFAGTSPGTRMFLVHGRSDTLLLPERSNLIRFMGTNNQPMLATCTDDQFHVLGNDKFHKDTLTSSITYLNWNNNTTSARIAGNNFETSETGNFEDAISTQELHFKNTEGHNGIILLEKSQKHILALGHSYPTTQLFNSPNGNYTLKLGANADLILSNDTNTRTISAIPGRIVLTVLKENDKFIVDAAGLSAGTDDLRERAAYLCVTDHGNVLLYRADGFAMWQSNQQ